MEDNKPTKEELKQKEEDAIKVAEELEGRQQIPQDNSEEEDEHSEPEEHQEVEVEPEEEVEQKEEDDEKPDEQAEPSKELYKKKFSASSRENQRINAKNRVINQALIEAEGLPEPTEEELQKEYPDWDLMSDVEKGLAKETIISRNWRKVIAEAKNQATKIEKWNESVVEFIQDPKTLNENPELEGKEQEFIDFATQEENNNSPFSLIIGAFLHQRSISKKDNKGKMFERGKGGSNDKPIPKNGKISLEDARKLRETNYTKWKEYSSKGLIDFNL